jgi:hypothetical protein
MCVGVAGAQLQCLLALMLVAPHPVAPPLHPTNPAPQLASGVGASARDNTEHELQQIYRELQMEEGLLLPLPVGAPQLQAPLGMAVDPRLMEELTTIHRPATAAATAGVRQLGSGLGGRGTGAEAGLRQVPAVLPQAPAAASGQLGSWPGQLADASSTAAGLLPIPAAASAAGVPVAAAESRAPPVPQAGPAAQAAPAAAAAASTGDGAPSLVPLGATGSSPAWPLSDDWPFLG